MHCPSNGCTETMEHRHGKFGGFWYCKHHGTISDRGAAIIQALTSPRQAGTAMPYSCAPESDPLMLQIHRQTLDFGVRPTELEEWIVDNESGADDEDEHWMHTRPY